MKLIQLLFVSLAMIISGQALALSADHPANPSAEVSTFEPADYFAGSSMKLAANEHQHDAAAPSTEEADGKGCKRGEGKGCCCCKCCDKGEGKEGSGCMRKSGGGHDHGDGKKGCGMMKKSMEMSGSDAGKTGGSDAHEGHH